MATATAREKPQSKQQPAPQRPAVRVQCSTYGRDTEAWRDRLRD